MPDVGAARSAAPPPRRSGGRARRGSARARQAWKSGSSPDSSVVPLADQQQHELRHPLGDRAQQRPVGAVAEVAERDGDDGRARVGRRERVGGERHEQRLVAALRAGEVAERVGDDDGQRRAQRSRRGAAPPAARAGAARRRRRPRSGPSASTRARRPGAGRSAPRASGYWSGWKITIARGTPGRRSRRAWVAASPSATDAGQPQVGAVGDRGRARPRRRPARVSRSSAWSRRMNCSSSRGSSSTHDRRRLVARSRARPARRCRRASRACCPPAIRSRRRGRSSRADASVSAAR